MSEVIPELKIAAREGYSRGREMYETILRAALSVLIEQGGKALTLRTVAKECGVKPGNLAYYFKTKEDLWRELLEAIMRGYDEVMEGIFSEEDASPEERIERIVDLVLDDITTKKTTRIFPELWAMSNFDPFVQERVDEFYQHARMTLSKFVASINPSLPPDEQELVALWMSASMEGMTIFVGYQKPWESQVPAIKRLMAKSFLQTIASLRPGEIKGLAEGKSKVPKRAKRSVARG